MYAAANHRLGISVLIATLLHVSLILSISLNWPTPRFATSTLEVWLAQQGSATQQEPEEQVQFSDTASTETASTEAASIERVPAIVGTASSIHSGIDSGKDSIGEQPVEPTPVNEPELAAIRAQTAQASDVTVIQTAPGFSTYDQSIGDLVQDIASQADQLAGEPFNASNTLRVCRIDGASPLRTVDTYYLRSWHRKIESVGKLNYPEEAKRRQLAGDMTLLVTIRADGSLQDVRILQTSGHSVLDEAARRIVRLAAPYSPFPVDMRQSTDLLEIVRSWQFRRPS